MNALKATIRYWKARSEYLRIQRLANEIIEDIEWNEWKHGMIMSLKSLTGVPFKYTFDPSRFHHTK